MKEITKSINNAVPKTIGVTAISDIENSSNINSLPNKIKKTIGMITDIHVIIT